MRRDCARFHLERATTWVTALYPPSLCAALVFRLYGHRIEFFSYIRARVCFAACMPCACIFVFSFCFNSTALCVRPLFRTLAYERRKSFDHTARSYPYLHITRVTRVRFFGRKRAASLCNLHPRENILICMFVTSRCSLPNSLSLTQRDS